MDVQRVFDVFLSYAPSCGGAVPPSPSLGGVPATDSDHEHYVNIHAEDTARQRYALYEQLAGISVPPLEVTPVDDPPSAAVEREG